MKYILIMSIFSFLFGNNSVQDKPIKVLSPEEFKAKIQDKDVQLIDVRTPAEFEVGHIEGAKNIDFFSGKFNVEFDKLDKEKPVYIYCKSGNRSRQTANKLAERGFKEIYDLQGGILNYK